MVRLLLLVAVLCMLECIAVIDGSVITFQSTPADVKQGLTTTLALNCSLSDTAASTSVIGKRDVTQTSDNVLLLTSLVVMKDGKDVASVNSAQAAHVTDGSSNVQVSGSVAGRTGFIQLTIRDPTLNQTGEFACEANAVSGSGHGVIFSTTVEVSSSTPSIADLVAFVSDLSKKNDDLDKKDANLESKVDVLEKTNQVLEQTNQVLVSKVDALEQTVSQLKNRSDTMVFFNARIQGNPHYAIGKDVIFDVVQDNMGNNYNGANGLFTCTVSGYYYFALGCLSMSDKMIGLDLFHNGKSVFTIYGTSGNSHQAAANSATLQLARGDIVKIHTDYDSTIDGYYCSFSGHLIEAL